MANNRNKRRQYRAFISYSHRDEYWAKWLQRALERYRVPDRISRSRGDPGSGTRRLHPVFRDREELASSSDLSGSIRTAMDHSEALIIVCSPDSAKSKWVNEEVRYFQQSGRDGRIFCLLVAGSTERNHPDCAFPTALLYSTDGLALPDPLAADISPGADGKRGAMLKIVAGMLGVGIDDLIQRDAQRQLRVRGAITLGSLAVSIITIGFAIVAQVARNDAEIRRVQAEDLIGFMLGDLRSKLEPVGRLDLLDAVGDEAMNYFSVLGNRGTDQEMLARAMALRQIGEVRFRQGRLVPAQVAFEESRDIAQALYEGASDLNDYLFELGQAEFWVGYAALEQSRLDQTRSSFLKYMEYSRELALREPDNVDYQVELMYAYSNLGTVSLELLDSPAAFEYFQESVAINEALVESAPDDLDFRYELANGYSWLGATRLQLGQLNDSEAAYRAAIDELAALHETGGDPIFSEEFGENLRLLAMVRLHQGQVSDAAEILRRAQNVFAVLVEHDPQNGIWRGDLGICSYHLAEILGIAGESDAARELLDQAISAFGTLVATDEEDWRIVEYLALAERLSASWALDDGKIDDAMTLSTQARQRMTEAIATETVKARTLLNFGIVAETHGRIQRASGNASDATSTWTSALAQLGTQAESSMPQMAVERQLASHLQRDEIVSSRDRRLRELGFDDPRFSVVAE
jgi:tetratricopeptide (TPR) repeat protein